MKNSALFALILPSFSMAGSSVAGGLVQTASRPAGTATGPGNFRLACIWSKAGGALRPSWQGR